MEETTLIVPLFMVAVLLLVFIALGRSSRPSGDDSGDPPSARHGRGGFSGVSSREKRRQPSREATGTRLFRARVCHVIDGDTLVIQAGSRQVRVRLSAIDCPEDGQEWGDIATYGLIRLVGGRVVTVEAYGRDPYGRLLATLYVDNVESGRMNVNKRMVVLGHAWVARRYYGHLSPERRRRLDRMERWARSKRVGLWRNPSPLPPWRWRQVTCQDAAER